MLILNILEIGVIMAIGVRGLKKKLGNIGNNNNNNNNIVCVVKKRGF